jgi:hypothetical protein
MRSRTHRESLAGGRLEDVADALAGAGRAFNVPPGANLLRDGLCLPERKGRDKRRRISQASVRGDVGLGRTSWVETGRCDVLRSSSIVRGSLRRSFLQPTRMMGRFEQKWRTSEIHCKTAGEDCAPVGVSGPPWITRGRQRAVWLLRRTFSWTLSSESGESTEKQMRMTCESGYDSGRRRS